MGTKVAILGTGPSAAFAFKACMDYGLDPDEVLIYGTEVPSLSISAPVFFHDVPSSIREDCTEHTIGYIADGEAEEYMCTQWGEEFAYVSSSFPKKSIKIQAYNPNEVLPLLWEGAFSWKLSGRMQRRDLYRVSQTAPLVLQTFSLWDGVPRRYQFRYLIRQRDGVNPQAWLDKLGYNIHDSGTLGFFLYNGNTSQGYIRIAILDGVVWYEYPSKETIPYDYQEQAISFIDIHPTENRIAEPARDNIVLLGRNATWDRAMLAHQAYSMTYTVLSERII